MLRELQQKAFRWYLYNPISSFQCSIFASWAVFQDVLDKDASHHFSITQAASHPSSSNNADPQWLARLSPEFDPLWEKEDQDKLKSVVIMTKLHLRHLDLHNYFEKFWNNSSLQSILGYNRMYSITVFISY